MCLNITSVIISMRNVISELWRIMTNVIMTTVIMTNTVAPVFDDTLVSALFGLADSCKN